MIRGRSDDRFQGSDDALQLEYLSDDRFQGSDDALQLEYLSVIFISCTNVLCLI